MGDVASSTDLVALQDGTVTPGLRLCTAHHAPSCHIFPSDIGERSVADEWTLVLYAMRTFRRRLSQSKG